jgi:hypothetical protein
MALDSIDELYQRQIRPLPAQSRLRLLALMALDLAADRRAEAPESRSLFELEGLGAEIWQGIDATEYVRGLRDEWGQGS